MRYIICIEETNQLFELFSNNIGNDIEQLFKGISGHEYMAIESTLSNSFFMDVKDITTNKIVAIVVRKYK